MTEKNAVYRIINDKPPLAGEFERIFQHVASDYSCEASYTLAAFATSLLGDIEFDLSTLNRLAKADQNLALDLFYFCMSEGLTEDERSAASAAFAPFVEIHKPGARH
ncbi:MAG: hypothetical protein WCQ50_03505 [Spirochaetota bacterium]